MPIAITSRAAINKSNASVRLKAIILMTMMMTAHSIAVFMRSLYHVR